MNPIYDASPEEWKKCVTDPDKIKIASTWMQDNTLDRWRHARMLAPIVPLISPDSSWLTVGDGRFGTDAHFIISHGAGAHATDLSDELLKIGSQTGFIKSFGAENAEDLSFEDGSFDYVLIKEALHHLPRPWLALYEAFRVCRKGVVLIEPNDDWTHVKSTLGSLKNSAGAFRRQIKRFLSMPESEHYAHSFEPVGNYVYRVNPHELEKFLLGMHHRHIGTIGVNDAYEEGVEFIRLDSRSPSDLAAIKRLKKSILKADKKASKGLSAFNMIAAILFKSTPCQGLCEKLSQHGWAMKVLPDNPYIACR